MYSRLMFAPSTTGGEFVTWWLD